jgi:hypothetical protein
MRFDDEPSQDEAIAEIRLRSQTFVQFVFCGFTLFFVTLALVAHHAPEMLALSASEPRQIADTFLFLAAAYALCLLVWEHIYAARRD